MKLKISELVKAVDWIKKNLPNEEFAKISISNYGDFLIRAFDSDYREVIIKFSDDNKTGTKITKTESM